MPKHKRPTEIGGYWLSHRDNSPSWCRTWFDPATRQTRRASLGTDDFQQAELKLAAWIAKNAEVRDQNPADMPLATVLTRYWHGHAINLPSATQAKIELRYWSDFFTTDMVIDLTPTRQEAFVDHLRGLGHSSGYISRILSTGRAAIRRAHKRGELLAAPFVADIETAEDRRVKDPKGRPITVEELAALFDAARHHHVLMFLLLACCTLARPDAILALTVFQRDREAGDHQPQPGRPAPDQEVPADGPRGEDPDAMARSGDRGAFRRVAGQAAQEHQDSLAPAAR